MQGGMTVSYGEGPASLRAGAGSAAPPYKSPGLHSDRDVARSRSHVL